MVMASVFQLWILVVAMVVGLEGAIAQDCNKTFSAKSFANCSKLGSLGASLAWTLHSSNHTIDFAFTGMEYGPINLLRSQMPLIAQFSFSAYQPHTTAAWNDEDADSVAGWVGWGINPTGGLMPGTQALVAFWDTAWPNVVVYQYDLTVAVAYHPETPPYPVSNLSVLYRDTSVEGAGTVVTIFTTLHLASNLTASLNHVWNKGFRVVLPTLSPGGHHLTAENRASRVNIDMVTGAFTSISDNEHLKNAHGIINVISYGMLMPLGVMVARYLRGSDPLWFHLHRACQTTAYVLGVVGFGMGLRLQTYAPVLLYHKHRDLGVAIFVFTTLQVLALVLRPHKDNKWRKYWNVYHHLIGYTTIALIVVNVITGIDILDPGNRYRIAYFAYIAVLVAVSALLEVWMWTRWFKNRKSKKEQMHNVNIQPQEIDDAL